MIVAAGVVVYANSFTAPWVFDGSHFIRDNVAIRRWWPPWEAMRGSNRPLAMYTFAVNYALGSPEVWGYHAVNLAIHLAAALALYGIVRRSLSSPRLRPRFGQAAPGLALAVAVLWLVHPLQTQSVTYLYQRFESLMGLFFLLTFYTFLRGIESDRPWPWYAASVVCWLMGLGCKETAAVAPLVLLWYDRALAADSWGQVWRRRGALYGLFAAVLGVGLLYVASRGAWYAAGGVMAFEKVSVVEYALSQPGVILHYLRLCVWPQGQCLDYAWPVAHTPAEIVGPLLAVGSLMAGTVWCVFRRPGWGFLGGAFFLTLAPTSSLVPIADLAFEQRMYLPLAAVVAAIVVGAYEIAQRVPSFQTMPAAKRRTAAAAAVTMAAVALGLATMARNAVYGDEATLWCDVVEKSPNNARARVYLGNALRRDRPDLAAQQYRIATEIQPDLDEAHNNLANLLQRADPHQALRHYEAALRVNPANAEAHNNLANLLARQGRFGEAVDHYREALRLRPDYRQAETNLGIVLGMQRDRAAHGMPDRGRAGSTFPEASQDRRDR